MELEMTRVDFTETTTISDLLVDGDFMCHILEDTDRDLHSGMTLSEIQAEKVQGKTAIPRGRYPIVVTYSNRFKKPLPLLQGVPGYDGVRIHPGNFAEDTDGCLLPGCSKSADLLSVGQSQVAFKELFKHIQEALDAGEDVFITID